MYIFFMNFGCKVNQAETDKMIKSLQDYDAEYTEDMDKADAVVINTCAVTKKAQKDIEKSILKLRKEKPSVIIAATGCLAELLKDDLKDFGVDHIISNADKLKTVSLLASQAKLRADKGKLTHTRAFVKIQDGCNSFCSYCIIPYLRGKPSSKPPQEVVEEVKQLIEDGFKEIVISGIHIGIYGSDLEYKVGLVQLLESLAALDGNFRLRLSSLYVQEISEELVNLVAKEKKICPHFHISLQSASAHILKRMGRKYTPQDFLESVELIRSKLPHANIGIDLITGFPGETEERFIETMELLKELPEKHMLDYMHVFPYSPRPFTKAAEFEEHVAEDIRRKRAKLVRQEADRQKLIRTEFMKGQTVRVLSEKGGKGHTDNFYLVRLNAKTPPNIFIESQVLGVSDRGVLVIDPK